MHEEKRALTLEIEKLRFQIALELNEIVAACSARAKDKDASLPHAKFLVELMGWQPPAALEKKKKLADEQAELDEPKPRSVADILLEELNKRRID